jgi:hypothetical protein
MRTLIMNATPGYPLSGGIALCAPKFADEVIVTRRRDVVLAPLGCTHQGTGVSVAVAGVAIADQPTRVSASTSERSPG